MLLVIVLIFGFTLWVILPDTDVFGRKDLQLGLDLKGGVQLVYQVEFADNATASDRSSLMNVTILKIQQRIDKFGVTEPVISKVGEDRIMIQLPGFTDSDAAKSLVQQTGFLEFRIVEVNANQTAVTLNDYLSQSTLSFIDPSETADRLFSVSTVNNDGTRDHQTVAILTTNSENQLVFTNAAGEPISKEALAQYSTSESWIPARGTAGQLLTGDLLQDAQPNQNTSQITPSYVVSITWKAEGTEIFDQVASKLYNRAPENDVRRQLGIFLDGKMLSSPQILQQSYGGSAQIEGSFTSAEVQELANLLKSGSLPMPIGVPIFEDTVSATLGAEFVDKSLIAGIIGLILVMIFMIAYYRLPGLMASIALIFYATLTLAIFKLWPVTLSLGGIGGFIVSMGIAVDANVLIFERMKEEFRAGRTLGAAIEAGFHRAWSAIWDSNMTTFIACIILYWLGSAAMHNAAIIGFAVTLFVGAIVSMFTAVTGTRTLLRTIGGTGLSKYPKLFTVTGGKK